MDHVTVTVSWLLPYCPLFNFIDCLTLLLSLLLCYTFRSDDDDDDYYHHYNHSNIMLAVTLLLFRKTFIWFNPYFNGNLVAEKFCHNGIMLKYIHINSLLLFSLFHNVFWTGPAALGSCRCTTFSSFWENRSRKCRSSVREDQAEEWGLMRGSNSPDIFISSHTLWRWEPRLNEAHLLLTDWSYSSFWRKVQKVH